MHPNPCTIAALCSNNAVHVLTGGAGQGGSDDIEYIDCIFRGTASPCAQTMPVQMLTGGAGQGGSDEEGQGPKKGLFGLPFMARAQVRKAWLMSY